MEAITLKDLFDLGFSAILFVMLVALWKRFNQFVDAWVSYLQKRADHGEAAAQRALESSSTIPIIRNRNGS